MKKVIPVLAMIFLMTGFSSCTKEPVDTSIYCDNDTKDGNELEIDCGGACDPCPDNPSFSCKQNGEYFIGRGASGQVLGPSIRVYTTNQNNRPMNFMFIPREINVPLPLSASNFDFQGEPYTIGEGDTGHIYVTAHDTMRNIISGTFSYQGQRVTKSFVKCIISEGVFSNVRYN